MMQTVLRTALCGSLLLAGLLGHGVAGAAAGYIQLVLGQATVWERGGTQRPAQKGVQLYEGDAVVTGPTSTVQIRMSDDALILVYSNSRVKIDQYIYTYNKGGKDSGALQLVKGAIRTVTGLIGQNNKDSFTVKTPAAAIGIRGTDFDTAYVEAGSAPPGASPGTYNRVYSGATTLKTAAGRVDVNENEAAFVGLKPGDKPERLKEIPEFMRKLEKEGAPGAASAPAQDIITLRHRSAEDIMPLIRPLLDGGAVLTGQGSRLVLAAPEGRRAALLAAIAAFDIPPRRLQIAVRFDNPAGGNNSVEVSTRARGNEPVEQRLQVVEGKRAFFYATQSQIPKQLLVSAPGLLLLQNPQSPPSGGGLEILPRISGDRVILEFYLQQNTTVGAVSRAQQTQRIGSTLSAKLGEWVEAGGQLTGGAAAGGVTVSTQELRGGGRLLYLRAIEIQ
jgi:hypothetical protein